jgi:hypothetical protein
VAEADGVHHQHIAPLEPDRFAEEPASRLRQALRCAPLDAPVCDSNSVMIVTWRTVCTISRARLGHHLRQSGMQTAALWSLARLAICSARKALAYRGVNKDGGSQALTRGVLGFGRPDHSSHAGVRRSWRSDDERATMETSSAFAVNEPFTRRCTACLSLSSGQRRTATRLRSPRPSKASCLNQAGVQTCET